MDTDLYFLFFLQLGKGWHGWEINRWMNGWKDEGVESINRSINQSIRLSICLSIYPAICLLNHPSITFMQKAERKKISTSACKCPPLLCTLACFIVSELSTWRTSLPGKSVWYAMSPLPLLLLLLASSTYGLMDGWMDGWMDGPPELYCTVRYGNVQARCELAVSLG